jgi:hypothetical protein
MIDASSCTRIFSALTADAGPRESLWCILDAARDESIYGRVETVRRRQCCLYAGDLPWQLRINAPYLVELYDDAFTHSLLREGWGNSWGVFFRSEASMEALRRHLRTFLRVADQQGRRLLFRYYDPRVLRAYLPTCLPAELNAVFGPIHCFFTESSEADMVLRFGRDRDRLNCTSLRFVESAAPR